ncbi:Pentatricopeptide repeat-containing protein [Platanthera guangdongensis]|uniref:Pentatricopeptide repeat-containing protein n=1 Tax=Platanthera guangdongensis TaxID=2320717 RepID=A0ABR2LIT2_9ASPA
MRNVKPFPATIFQLEPLLRPPPHLPPSTPQEIQPCCADGNHPHLLRPTAVMTSHTTDFPHLLKACASLSLLPLGRLLHQRAVVLGVAAEPYLATSLLHMYAMNSRMPDAHQMFDQMPVRNVVPYSAMISAYCRSANMNAAISIYITMLNDGIRPNSVTFLGLLSGVSALFQVEFLHASLVQLGFEDDLFVANSMMNVYSLCERADLARSLFDSMPFRDTVSWNSMVAGYSRTGSASNSMILLHKMRLERFFPDQQTFQCLIASLTNSSRRSGQCGPHLHASVITSGFESDSHLATAIISMYLKFTDFDRALKLFDRSPEKDVVMWTAMISGLVRNDQADEALLVFRRMAASLSPSNESVAIAVSACAQLGLLGAGASIHGFVIRHCLPLDNAVENSLITLYAKCGHLRRSQSLFESMEDRDLVSWNAIVSGFAHNARLEEALGFFTRMISAKQRPDAITVVSLLQGCAAVAALDQGKLMHSFMIRYEVESSLSMETSLVDMYSKCGHIGSAEKCFDRMVEKDVVAWSAIIAGYAAHGMGEVALKTYSDFLKTEMLPNSVMLLSVLSACSHSGHVSEGLSIFDSMKEKFGVDPRLEHCSCVVDLLCRAGNVEEGLKFIRSMSPAANDDVLGIILDACRATDRGDLAEKVAEEMELKQDTAGSFVQLAHNYAAKRRWDDVGEALRRMRGLGLKKTPGWSFVELNGRKYLFFADDSSHTQWDEIIGLLNILRNEMKDVDDDNKHFASV